MLSQTQIDEIRTLYRDAKNKQREIGILAQLYNCEKYEIRDAIGLEDPGPKLRKPVEIPLKKKTEYKKPVIPRKEIQKTDPEEITAPTRCQPGKSVDVWDEGPKKPDADSISKALQGVLDEFDANEKKMRELMEKMVPLAEEYKEIELRQQNIAEFIENFCRMGKKKPT